MVDDRTPMKMPNVLGYFLHAYYYTLLQYISCFSCKLLLSPLKIWINLNSIPIPKDALCQVWLKLALRFLRRRWKCVKFMTTTMDNVQITIRKAHLSLRLRWAKNSSSIGFFYSLMMLNWLDVWTHIERPDLFSFSSVFSESIWMEFVAHLNWKLKWAKYSLSIGIL